MRVSIQLRITALLMIACGNAFGYGATGHRIAGLIAQDALCEEAEAGIDELLEGETLAEAGLWADRIRSNPRWNKAKPWHYINVPDDVAIVSAPRNPKGDVLTAIDRFYAEFTDESLSRSQRARALRFLVHFIADVHQPLHVGRDSDRGGNRIEAGLHGRKTNLHALWDARVLLRDDRRARGYTVAGQARTIGTLVAPRVVALQYSAPLEWANESQALRAAVYRSVPARGVFVPDARYLELALETTRRRLGEAGLRIAGVLNGVYCVEPPAS